MAKPQAYIQQRWLYVIREGATEPERVGRPPDGRQRFAHSYDAEKYARTLGWEVITQREANGILAKRQSEG